jgi:hypothetical protein
MNTNPDNLSLLARLRLALSCFSQIISNPSFATRIEASLPAAATKPVAALPPERIHADGLTLLSTLQREGRLIDFLQEDMSAFTDADIGAAARIVHTGCRKVLKQSLVLEPVLSDTEGASISVPSGFDAQQIRLTGNISGTPPFQGTLKHHGWKVSEINLPTVAESLDPRILAPAEVEL